MLIYYGIASRTYFAPAPPAKQKYSRSSQKLQIYLAGK